MKPREYHGRSADPVYVAWNQMVRRCHSPSNAKFATYGARGIQVCQRWRDSFAAFVADMGPRPAGMSLDRKDNNGHYEPGNCRWATLSEQRRNQRLHHRNTSGVAGVRWVPKRKSFAVEINKKYLGQSSDFFEAVCMRKSAELRFHPATT